MKNFQIKNTKNALVIHEGEYSTFKQCLEDAVKKDINLDNADLRNQNLQNINIDSAQLYGAAFDGSNLNDANLSEGQFESSSFKNTSLIGACMAESNFKYCDFSGVSFGANTIAGSRFDHATFNTLSCFTLDFLSLEAMDNCRFEGATEISYSLSKPPIVITGLFNAPMVFLNDAILMGHQNVTTEISAAVQVFLNLKPANAAQMLQSLTNGNNTAKRTKQLNTTFACVRIIINTNASGYNVYNFLIQL